MTFAVSICRVSRVPAATEMADLNADHRALYGATAGEMKILRDPKDPNQTAALRYDLADLLQQTGDYAGALTLINAQIILTLVILNKKQWTFLKA